MYNLHTNFYHSQENYTNRIIAKYPEAAQYLERLRYTFYSRESIYRKKIEKNIKFLKSSVLNKHNNFYLTHRWNWNS